MLEGVTKPDRQTLGYGGTYKDKDKKLEDDTKTDNRNRNMVIHTKTEKKNGV